MEGRKYLNILTLFVNSTWGLSLVYVYASVTVWISMWRSQHAQATRGQLSLLNVLQVSGWSALHIAAWNGNIDLTQLLLECERCQVDPPGPGSVTPVFLAAQRRHSCVLQLLVDAGCDVTRRAALRMRGGGVANDVTVLHVAAQAGHVGVVRRLLAAGAPIDWTMKAGQLASVTALYVAVEAGHSDVVDLLIDSGCNVNGRTSSAMPTMWSISTSVW